MPATPRAVYLTFLAVLAGLLSVAPAAAANSATVYYKTGWATTNIHYGVNGTWTTVPGVKMDAACTGWTAKTIDLGTATGFQVTFNNGSGTWDNNGGANYTLPSGLTTVRDGVVTTNSASPCVPDTEAPSVPTGLGATVSGSSIKLTWTAATDNVGVTGYEISRTGPDGTVALASTAVSFTDSGLSPNTEYTYTVLAKDAAGNKSAASEALSKKTGDTSKATVYYYTKTRAWSAYYLHYQPTGGAWTTVPGITMDAACTDWVSKQVDLGSATGMKATFNNGSGTWDNNGGSNYTIGLGRTTVKDGVVTADAPDPCYVAPPDTVAPSTPTDVAGTADGVTVTLSWSPSTDNVAVTGYVVTQVKTGGASSTFNTGPTTAYSVYGLDPQAEYTYTVQAKDAAGNVSLVSSSAKVKTGDATEEPPGGTPLGGDPRKDSIYFAMTARFMDGESSNNRGGALHTLSGNAANKDPMFRGDFKGIIDKLDYIKGLGFSAIWITPVVLNRSDYDFHGYHGWDFYRIDPRLTSAGASYQDLINKAHARGIKIYQDVVYNHSSRWGAKGLSTPKHFGRKDLLGGTYYDDPVEGKEYNALEEDENGRPYTGDLWSTTQPAGDRCRNWGVLISGTTYNCQWPNATSGQYGTPQTVKNELYHPCWIGNWEGEDAKDCWIHEDLADFNTENANTQKFLIDVYNKYIDMGVDGFRIDTAVHIPRVMWNRHFLPALRAHAVAKFGQAKADDFYVFGEVAQFVHDKWNRGSVNHSAPFYTWKERKDYSADDTDASHEQYAYENGQGTANQPTSTNCFLNGNSYHAPDHSKASGMNVIDMRMHMNFSDAHTAFYAGMDSDDAYNDCTYNTVYVDSHDYGPGKSQNRYDGGTDAWAENMSLMWTFRGVPTLYYGSEIEFQKGARIDCGPTCPLSTTGRAYYGDQLAGTVTAADFGVVSSSSGQVAATLQKPLVQHVQRLNRIRRAVPALQMGQYSREGVSGSMAFKRRYTADGVDSFALVAISGNATFSGIPNGTYTDVVTGHSINVQGGSLTASVSGKGNLKAYVLNGPGQVGAAGPYLK